MPRGAPAAEPRPTASVHACWPRGTDPASRTGDVQRLRRAHQALSCGRRRPSAINDRSLSFPLACSAARIYGEAPGMAAFPVAHASRPSGRSGSWEGKAACAARSGGCTPLPAWGRPHDATARDSRTASEHNVRARTRTALDRTAALACGSVNPKTATLVTVMKPGSLQNAEEQRHVVCLGSQLRSACFSER